MAVASASGILAALVVTRYVLAPLLRGRPRRARLLERGAALGDRALDWLRDHRRTAVGFVSLTALACVLGLPCLRWRDALADINGADPALRAETDRVRKLVSRVDEGRLVIVSARDEQQALRLNDEVAARLEPRATSGPAGRRRVAARVSLVRGSPDTQPRGGRGRARPGRADVGRARARRVQARGVRTVSPDGRRADRRRRRCRRCASPISRRRRSKPIVRPFIVQLGDEIGVLTFVRDSRIRPRSPPPSPISPACAVRPGAVSRRDVRPLPRPDLEAIGIGLLLIVVDPLLPVPAFPAGCSRRWSPAILAAAATLGLLGTAGVQTNLLARAVVAARVEHGRRLLGIFLVECGRTRKLGPTTMSLLGAAVTTMLSFGLLALSRTHALRAIGLTTGIGTTLSFLLAPLSLAIMRPEWKNTERA